MSLSVFRAGTAGSGILPMAARAPCARPEARLYFLARDMYLMRDVYHTLYPQEETGYLQVSRRSLAPAFLAAEKTLTPRAAAPRYNVAEFLANFCMKVIPTAEMMPKAA